jgi:hypothetical protein
MRTHAKGDSSAGQSIVSHQKAAAGIPSWDFRNARRWLFSIVLHKRHAPIWLVDNAETFDVYGTPSDVSQVLLTTLAPRLFHPRQQQPRQGQQRFHQHTAGHWFTFVFSTASIAERNSRNAWPVKYGWF